VFHNLSGESILVYFPAAKGEISAKKKAGDIFLPW
jgi:hypothetical protein